MTVYLTRPAVPADAAGIEAVRYRAWTVSLRDLLRPCGVLSHVKADPLGSEMRSVIRDLSSNQNIQVAELHGQIVGYVYFGKPLSDGPRSDAEVHSIHVARNSRGSGSAGT